MKQRRTTHTNENTRGSTSRHTSKETILFNTINSVQRVLALGALLGASILSAGPPQRVLLLQHLRRLRSLVHLAGITGSSTYGCRPGAKCSVLLPPKISGGRSFGLVCVNGPTP